MELVFELGIGGKELKRVPLVGQPIPRQGEKVMFDDQLYLVITVFHYYDGNNVIIQIAES